MQSGERDLAAMVGDRESVVFLAPMGAHSAITVEAWAGRCAVGFADG